MKISLHSAQSTFRHSPALYRGFVGGRGCGKSWIGAYDMIRRARPGRLYMVAAPTYPMLRDSSMRSFEAIARSLNFLKEITATAGNSRALLGNGAEILFRSADDPNRLRGPNLSGVWLDEAGEMSEEAYLIVIACLREAGEQGWLSATFTPRGRSHWTYRTFGADRPDTQLFHAQTKDNPFNPSGFEATLRGQYTSAFAEQELAGRFVDLNGTMAKREWFRILDVRPTCTRLVRAWDFAATPENAAGDGDYTVGSLVGQYNGIFAVLDVVRCRVAGGQVADVVRRTAERDGRQVQIALEQEPGSSGKVASAYLTQHLAGYYVKTVPATGSKVQRALPFLAQAEAGNVSLVRSAWVTPWLEEAVSFPGGEHDDQIDATALAFNQLCTGSGSGFV